MAYDGLYGELSTRGATNEILNLAIATKDQIEFLAEQVEEDQVEVNAAVAVAQTAASESQAHASAAASSASDANATEIAVGNLVTDAQTAATASANSANLASGYANSASVSASTAQTAADSAQVSADIYPNLAAGEAATTAGQYFSIVSPDSLEYLILYLRTAGSSIEQKRYPSAQIDQLSINRAKAFPLKAMVRAGGTSAANTVLNNLLLSVKVIGDSQYTDGKYFRVAYFQNGTNIGGNTGSGIILEECLISTYSSTGAAVTIHNYTDGDVGIDRTGGVQTLTVVPSQRPKLRFLITIDANYLPALGTPVNALTSPFGGYSWIIEQSNYLSVQGMGDTIQINKYRVYPQKVSARNNATSAEPTAFMNTLLDIQVTGARPNKLYRVAYFKNGTNALPGPQDGWIFEEFDALNYSTANNPALTVVNYTDTAPNITRSGVQTVVIDSPVVPGLSFRVTLDTTALPAFGTQIGSNLSFQAGYSYIIDPQRYVINTTSGLSGTQPVQWSMDGVNNLRVAWSSNNSCFRLRIGPNGVNQLPNIIQIEWAPGSDVTAAVWQNLNTTGSDWFPPMQVAAESSGDGGSIAFTGGAHGSNGDSTGDPTARNLVYLTFADGQVILPNTNGRANRVSLEILNELMGYNTKTLGRYILRQAFAVDITPASLVLTANVTPLESVSVITDYALQGITFGFQGTQLVLGGQNTSRIPFVNGSQTTSGAKSAYPNAWAVVFQEPTHGQFTLWMDKSYEDGDGKYVDPAGVLLRGESTTKWYLGVVLPALTGTPIGHSFAAGSGYKYRAGLSWQGPSMQPASLDSIISMNLNGHNTFAYGLPDANFVRVS